MDIFKIFSKKKIDGEILDNYELIYNAINEIYQMFEEFMRNKYLPYLKRQEGRTKEERKILRVYSFFGEIRKHFINYNLDIQGIRRSRKEYDFDNAEKIAEKMEIKSYQDSIISLLDIIEKNVKNIKDLPNLKDANLDVLEYEMGNIIKTSEDLAKLEIEDEIKLLSVIKEIREDAIKNAKENRWLYLDGKKTYYSLNLGITKLRILELIPLLNNPSMEIKKRSLFVFELHKDKICPILHYNLEYGDKRGKPINIHVFPKNYREELERRYIKRAA